MSDRSDAIAIKVQRQLMRYFHKKRLCIPYDVSRQEFERQLMELSARLEVVNPNNLMKDGPVKDNMHSTHARVVALKMLEGFVESEKADRLAYEETLKPGYIPPVS